MAGKAQANCCTFGGCPHTINKKTHLRNTKMSQRKLMQRGETIHILRKNPGSKTCSLFTTAAYGWSIYYQQDANEDKNAAETHVGPDYVAYPLYKGGSVRFGRDQLKAHRRTCKLSRPQEVTLRDGCSPSSTWLSMRG